MTYKYRRDVLKSSYMSADWNDIPRGTEDTDDHLTISNDRVPNPFDLTRKSGRMYRVNGTIYGPNGYYSYVRVINGYFDSYGDTYHDWFPDMSTNADSMDKQII